MTEKIKKILHDNDVQVEEEDVENVLIAIQEVFEYMTTELKKKEPHASNTIERYEIVISEISSLIADLNWE